MKLRGRQLLIVILLLILSAVFILKKAGNFPVLDHNKKGADAISLNRHPSKLVLTKHAKCRMLCRHISRDEITDVLETGEVNLSKSELSAHPDPKYAVEGITGDNQHVRIIFAASGSEMVVVTCIDLDREWSCDCP